MLNVTIPSLDQLKIMVAVVDTGSFSTAAKVLHRSQPVVSYAIGNLEAQLGIRLFERRGQRPVLTEAGKMVLAYARRISLVTDEMRAGVSGLVQGVESEVSIVVDVLFSIELLATALKAFADRYPSIAFKLRLDALGGVEQLVMDGSCQMGISCLVRDWPDQLEVEDFGVMHMVPVAAPSHPLASYPGPIPVSLLREHIQLALSDRTHLTDHQHLAVSGIRSWRVSDMSAKTALLRNGIGWGHMPEHYVRDDLATGRLVRLSLSARKGGSIPYTMIHRVDAPPGLACRWLFNKLVSISS